VGPDVPLPTTLHGRWLTIARTAWVAMASLAVALFVVGLPTSYRELRTLSIYNDVDRDVARGNLAQLGLSSDFYAGYQIALGVALATVSFVLAAIIFRRKSDQPIALFVALVLVLLGATFPTSVNGALGNLHPFWESLANILIAFSVGSVFIFFYLFSDGRFVPRWTRWLAILCFAWLVYAILFPDWPFNPNNWPDQAYALYFLGWLLTGVFAQVYRYRHVSGPVERQQTKWVFCGFAAALLGYTGIISLYVFFPSLQPGSLADLFVFAALYCFILLIPLSIAVAILRRRLWDIDVIINRTLVYGTLTATLGLLYYLGVVLLQALLRGATGQGSSLAVVASTLTVAVLFMPLRRRIQTFIDRRFYRSKYDAQKTLESFGARVCNEGDLQKLSEALLEVVDETMKPSHASLWLKPPPKKNKPQAVRTSEKYENANFRKDL
jgi:hypothetical protein